MKLRESALLVNRLASACGDDAVMRHLLATLVLQLTTLLSGTSTPLLATASILVLKFYWATSASCSTSLYRHNQVSQCNYYYLLLLMLV